MFIHPPLLGFASPRIPFIFPWISGVLPWQPQTTLLTFLPDSPMTLEDAPRWYHSHLSTVVSSLSPGGGGGEEMKLDHRFRRFLTSRGWGKTVEKPGSFGRPPGWATGRKVPVRWWNPQGRSGSLGEGSGL